MPDPAIKVVRANALPIEKLFEAIGDARLVLLGEASHGTRQFYRIRAELTQARARERYSCFEEPGTLEQVAALAFDWCRKHLKRQP